MKKILSTILVIAIMLTVVSSMAFASDDRFTNVWETEYSNFTFGSAGNSGKTVDSTTTSGTAILKFPANPTSWAQPAFRVKNTKYGDNGDYMVFHAEVKYNYGYDVLGRLAVDPGESGTSLDNENSSIRLDNPTDDGVFDITIYYDLKYGKMMLYSNGELKKSGEFTKPSNWEYILVRAANKVSTVSEWKDENSDTVCDGCGTAKSQHVLPDSETEIMRITNYKATAYTANTGFDFDDLPMFYNGYSYDEANNEVNLFGLNGYEVIAHSDYTATTEVTESSSESNTYIAKHKENTDDDTNIYIQINATGLYDSAWKIPVNTKYVVLSADIEELQFNEESYLTVWRRTAGKSGSKHGRMTRISEYGPDGAADTKYTIKCIADIETDNVFYYIDGVLGGFVISPEKVSVPGFGAILLGNGETEDGTEMLKVSNVSVKGYTADATPENFGISGAFLKDGKAYNSLTNAFVNIDANAGDAGTYLTVKSFVAGYDADNNLVSAVEATENGADFDTTGVVTTKVFTWDSTTLKPYHFVTDLLEVTNN